MKVCFKITKAGGGSDIWTANLARALEGMGIETSIQRYSHNYQYAPSLLKLKHEGASADVIHTNTWNGFAFKGRAPLVVTEHYVIRDPVFDRYKNIPQKIFHKFVYGFVKKSLIVADRITSVSDYTKKRLKEAYGHDSIKIYNGINAEAFYPKKSEINFPGLSKKITLLFVGNMIRRKGADLLPKIMKELGDKFILICTSGLRKKIKRFSKNTYIVGSLSQKEVINYYNYCDIFLFPSRLEGLSLAVLEAMACAKPVVSTVCSSLPEQVVNEKGGFLCETDNVKEFAEKIRILAESKVLRKEMGHFNRERVEKYFTLRQMAESYQSLYKNLLAS